MLLRSLLASSVCFLTFSATPAIAAKTPRTCSSTPSGTTSAPAPSSTPPPSGGGNNIPETVVIDGQRLFDARKAIKDGSASAALQKAVESITHDADGWLKQGPWSVVDKGHPPPNSSDIHDYYSMAPYFWPSKKTSSNPDGCPYIQKDGKRNPEVDNDTDRQPWAKVAKSIPSLSLAWYYTGKDAYAKQAAKILRTWFVSEDTRMTPNLQFAQAIKCKNSGRYIGIIDFSQHMTSLLDAAEILESGPAPGWTKEDRDGFKKWAGDFYDWLSNSEFGKQETGTVNNHGTFADMQRAGLALFLNREDDVRAIANKFKTNRIDKQIAADGKEPLELERTRSFHYSCFTLMAFTRMALIADKVGVDLWEYKGSKGQSIFNAIKYLIPAATGAAKWPHDELKFQPFAALDVIHAAADAGFEAAKEAVKSGKLAIPEGGDLFYARPAPEQLDSIAG